MFMKRPEDLENKRIFLDITFSNPTIVQQYAWAYVTSEQNAYGAVTQKWYDGEVSKNERESSDNKVDLSTKHLNGIFNHANKTFISN